MMRRLTALALALLVSLTSGSGALALAPGEVTGLVWCPGTKDCLGWSPAGGATGYFVYRGDATGLTGLTDSVADSCLAGSYATATTGPDLGSTVTPGALHWYLVTASNLDGEGSAGDGSAGARVVDATGACGAGSSLVLNEVDYDQPGTDSGEFVEIYNGGAADRDLTDIVLILVNGLGGTEYDRVNLSEAGPSLPAGAFLVAGSAAVVATLPPGVLSVTLPSASNNMQNGAPDGIALFDTQTVTLLDGLSYEGSITAAQLDGIPGTFNLVDGAAATAADTNSVDGSMVRLPDGSDTHDDASDWQFSDVVSPGSANPMP